MRALLPALALLFLASPATAAVRRVALVVAHPEGGPGTEPLRYVERDARKLLEVLTELGGVDPADASVLIAPSADQVVEALSRAEARVAAHTAAGGQAMLLFYYSGHAASGELQLGDSRLDLATIKRALSTSRASVRVGLLDACQSGAITRMKGGRRGPSFVVEAEDARSSRGYVIITSSSGEEASQESDDLRGSFFTHYLVSGLRGAADRSGDGQVSLDEAYAYAYDRTVVHTAGTRGGTQHPTYTYDLQGNGAVVLTRLSGLGALVFPAEVTGTYLVYDVDRDAVVGEVEKPSGEARRLAVRPGRYAIRKRAREHLLLQRLRIGPQERLVVQESAFEAVAFEEDVTKGPTWVRAQRSRERGFSLTARGGYQAFFDAATRADLFHPSPLVGLRLEASSLLAPQLSLHLDGAFGQIQETLRVGPYQESHPVDFSLIVAGLGLTWDVWLGDLLIQMGPQLSALYASRSFADDAAPFQDLFTISPGALVGASWWLGRFALGIELRAHYLRYATELEDRSLGFGEGYLTVGYAP